jgi:hypothetical protein
MVLGFDPMLERPGGNGERDFLPERVRFEFDQAGHSVVEGTWGKFSEDLQVQIFGQEVTADGWPEEL